MSQSQEKCFYSTQGFFVCSKDDKKEDNKYSTCIQYQKEYKDKSFMIQSDNCKNPIGSRGLNCQNK